MGFAKHQSDQMVSLEAGWERAYWMRRFGVSEEDLRKAIEAVGHEAEDVRRYLRFKPRRVTPD